MITRLVVLIAVLGAIFGSYRQWVRPWMLDWGSTAAERQSHLPGDDIISGTSYTRAITIDAPAEMVWPWIAQTGQDRGGFYSYDILENLVGCEMPTEDFLRPEKQSWSLGDKLWMYPPEKAGVLDLPRSAPISRDTPSSSPREPSALRLLNLRTGLGASFWSHGEKTRPVYSSEVEGPIPGPCSDLRSIRPFSNPCITPWNAE